MFQNGTARGWHAHSHRKFIERSYADLAFVLKRQNV
jgi:hypothetical protein